MRYDSLRPSILPRSRLTSLGVTLVEVLVAMFVVAVIVSLSIPAISHVRESMRRTQCVAKLRSLMTATQNYSAVHQVYPPALTLSDAPPSVSIGRGYGVFVHVLPYLQQDAVYDSLNFTFESRSEVNRTIWQSHINAFVCPSQTMVAPDFHQIASGSFVFNRGHVASFERRFLNGPFPVLGNVTERDVADGLSTSVFFSENTCEKCVGSAQVKTAFEHGITAFPASYDEWHNLCIAGDFWTRSGIDGGWIGLRSYSHFIKPGARSCEFYPPFNIAVGPGASSMHGATVNVAMGDGSCRPISDSIDLQIWRSVGSIAGSENVQW